MRILLTIFSLFLTAHLLVPATLPAQSAQTWLIDAGNYDCIPVENFGLRGVRLWEPEESIIKRLGRPQSISYSDGVDDGGPYDITIYHYPDMDVEAIRQHVDRIIATSSAVAMPSGIRLGDSRTDIRTKFGRQPRSLSPETDEIHLVTCPVNGQWVQEDYVTLELDASGHLTVIRYEANRP